MNKVKERRNFIRFFSQLKARYLLKGAGQDWQECTIININRKGMCLKFNTTEKIEVGSIITLETFIPSEMESIIVEGRVKWFHPLMGGHGIGGIDLTDEIAQEKFAELCSIYSGADKVENQEEP